jgi:amino acid adenylation domain-containing protein
MTELLDRLRGLTPEKRRLLEMRLRASRDSAAGGLAARERTGEPLPVSFAQQRLWLIDRMTPGTALYNMAMPRRMYGPLDVSALERTLDALRSRHEPFRTVFAERDGEPVQVIHPFTPVPLPVVDLTHLPPEARGEEALRLARQDMLAPFDLARGPLFRATLLHLDDDDHALLLTMHHIVSDGWSLGVMGRELEALYSAFREGRPDPLPPLPLQYADYAVWQREWLSGERLQQEAAWWRERLAGAPTALELPTDRPRPPAPSGRGEPRVVVIPEAVASGLRALALAEGATLFAVLLGALRVVLARHAGQDEVVLGTTIAGRTRAEVEGLIGFFINSLALRTALSGDPTFRELVRRERETVLDAFQHQDLPFERVVEELRLPRDLSRAPVYQAMFSLHNTPAGGGGPLPELRLEPLGLEAETVRFDLSVEAAEFGGPIAVRALFATDLFDARSIELILEHYLGLLERVASDPDRRLSDLPLLDEEDRALVLGAWNDTSLPFDDTATLAELFEAQTDRTPDAIAVTDGVRDVTVRELEGAATRLSRVLRRRGVGPESRVGILLERGVEPVIALLAVLKAGGAYVPLDPEHPDERLRAVLHDGGIRVVVSQSALRAAADRAGTEVVCLECDRAEIEAEPAERLAVSATAENLAYVLYTSGSTGTPKGVAVRQRSVVNLLHALRRAVHGDEGPRRVTLNGPLTFDTSVKQWIQLLDGHALAVVPQEVRYDGAALRTHLLHVRADVLDCTPAQLRLLLDAAGAEPIGPARVLVGGEAIDPELWTELAARQDAAFFNVYGPTEATVDATALRISDAHSRPSLGGPVANVTAYVLDGELRPVPPGVPGELFIGGEGVARGYLNRPALTAERFAPDPFGAPGSRLYRSGDRMRWREDGTLDFLGRIDFQVKLRGLRIELGEIEALLLAEPAVRQAIAIVRRDGGEDRIVAYVVTDDPGAGTQLRARLAAALPPYMVPSAVVALDHLPLTRNGKVDRAALPSPEYGARAEHAELVTETERRLAAVWTEVLGAERVGAEDNFFDLGGHSLLAARVIARVREGFGADVPLRALFESPTVRELAVRVDALTGKAQAGPPLVPVPRDQPIPLSFAQERLWFLDQLDPGTPVYNVPHAVELAGPVDADALVAAVREIVRRHEALRTAFVPGADGPVQIVLPPDVFRVERVDLTSVAEDEREAEAERRIAEESRASFDLSAGPLLRATFFRLRPDRHVLLTVAHHTASDAWSTGILYRELTALYEAFSRGEPSPLPPLAIQYADFSAWQRTWLAGDTLEEQIAYWRERLAGAPATLELPTDRARPAHQDLRGGNHRFALSATAAQGARVLARTENATLFMVLLAAFQAVLHRWSGQDDVVVGTPILTRSRPELEGLIGFFGNTLALRTRVDENLSFRDLLGRVRDATLGAYAHQDLPFERLVDALGVERALSHPPLFQVMLTLQNAPPASLALGEAGLAGRRTELGTSRFDMTVGLIEAGEQMLGGVEFAAALWDQETIARMMSHLDVLLAAAVAAPDAPLSRLSMLSAAETEWIADFNRTERPAAAGVCVHDLFASQAALTPDAAALESGDESLTYAQVDARSNRLARRLAALGVGIDSRVAICLERSVDMPVAVLAVLKAGAAYVAVDPAYPAERIAYMLRDSRAAVLLTTDSVLQKLPVADTPVLRLDADGEAIAAESDAPLRVDVHPENLAYVLYTSGSTGLPKGAALPHRALVNLLRWQLARWEGRPAARTLQFASLSFDVSFQEIFAAWAAGGTLVLTDDDTRRDAEALLALLRGQRVERLFLPFAALQNLAETAEHVDGRLPELREIITAGEALRTTPQLRALFAANPGLRLDNQYGPSETHVISAHQVAEDASEWPLLPPIGAPVDNTRLHVLDGRLLPAPVGVPGELFAAGENLARGYLNRPALTAERFIPDPFGAPGSRLYRTGDRARWLPAGELEYVGRTDFQVKVRGFRVEPGEIEAALGTHPEVREAAVAVRGEGAEKRIVAYLVPVEGAAPTLADLRAHVASRVPEYMVPAAWVMLERMPLTPSGKVDRRALPAPDDTAEAAGRVAPRTPAEEVVAGIWARVLGVAPGVHDNFFDLGGHSLRATQVMSRIREAFGADLPLRALFEAPTVAGLAARAAAARARSGFVPPPLVPAARDRALPLSFAQQRFWFVSRLAGARTAYTIPVALHLRGELDAGAMHSAVNALVARHESLRTVFRVENGEPVQVILPELHIPLPFADLAGTADAAEQARVAGEEMARAPFDLEAGPLFRARLLRVAEEEHVLLLAMHHIVSDGWSLGVLFRELSAFYGAAREGRDAALAPLPVQYADYAVWQRERLDGPALERELAFWRETLDGAPVLALPTDRPHPPLPSFRGGMVPFALTPELSASVAELGRRHGATVFMTLLAAFDVLLARWSGGDDVVIGSPIAGRTPEETEGLIGVFLNTLTLRATLAGDPTFSALLEQVRGRTLDTYAHQDVPFERLVEELKVERSVARHPLFQVLFSMQPGGTGAALEFSGLRVGASEPDTGSAKVDLTLAMVDAGGVLHGGFKYAQDVFDEATIRRLAEHFGTLIASAVAAPDSRVSALRMMGEDERRTVVEGWNRTAADHPVNVIHRLVSEQARRTPNAPAVVSGDTSVTYSELDRRANRIAHRLARMGAGLERRVALLVDRSPELVAAELGILRTGAAYVPMDPLAPPERIAYMVRDAGVVAVVAGSAWRERLAQAEAPVLWIDEEDLSGESTDDPDAATDVDAIAYVIYTSGSTGTPKGVAVSHRGAANLVGWYRSAFDLGPEDRGSLLGSPAFDASVMETWSALCTGASLHVLPDSLRADPAGLARWLGDTGVTVGFLPTPAAEAVLEAIDHGVPCPARLRALLTGGDALRRRGPRGLRLVNVYGPTENSVISTTSLVSPAAAGLPPIGKPVHNHQCYVLDGRGEPVPIGVPGELHVAGEGLARGYLGRPALTAERFSPDPFATEPGARMYATGDRVRWRADGELEFLGRTDDQVKVRGFRVELGEIEAALLAHPAIAQAAVTVRGEGANRMLVAYVQPADGAVLDGAAVRAHVRERLPDYMVPARAVLLERLPLGATGKVDRRRLPEPSSEEPRTVSVPQSATERTIAAVWREVLEVDAVGLDDNFFEIGGHSMLVARVQEKLGRALGREVSVVDLFQHSTVAALAAHLDPHASPATAGTAESPHAEAADRGASRRDRLRRRR